MAHGTATAQRKPRAARAASHPTWGNSSGNPAGNPAGNSAAAAIDGRFLLNVLRRHWKWVVPTGLVLATLAAAAVYSVVDPVYEASAWLRVDETAPFLAFESQERPEGYIKTQVELLRSPVVLGPAVVRAGLVGTAGPDKEQALIRKLAKRLGVSALGDSELVKVSYQSTEPAQSAKIVNAVVESYFALRGKDAATSSAEVIALLEQEQQKHAAEVARLQEQVRLTAEKVPGASSHSRSGKLSRASRASARRRLFVAISS